MSSEKQLSLVMSEFARTMLTDFPIQAILDHLAQRIVDVLPVSGAGVTVISPGNNAHYVAASDDDALRLEQLQTDLGDGPCFLAYETGEAIHVPDLMQEERFPYFSPSALAVGLAGMFTFPLRLAHHQLGALDLYRNVPGELSGEAITAAQTLADVAAAYLLSAKARTDLQDASDRSQEAALHDSLTGLPNRVLMLDRLDHAVGRSRRTGKTSAVAFFDLDRFKSVNDTYGRQVGDDLLIAVADRLTKALRPGDSLARLCGDEFVILCEDLNPPDRNAGLVARFEAALGLPFALSGQKVNVTASVGIAFSGTADADPEQLIHWADMAMYQAKRAGGGSHHVSDQREQRLAEDEADLERDLFGAAARGELYLAYQPIVGTVDGVISGAEALLRWNHPTRGLVSPAVLIPLAERSGLIIEIGQLVLEQAWSDRNRWHPERAEGLTISVNVSAHQLMSVGFASSVAAVVAGGDDASAKLLTLEVTEGVFVREGKRALSVLNDLKELGVRIALDDFGTGYSSLGYLKRFPVDIVKIDQIFVTDLMYNSASQTIVEAILQLAHGLGMTVIAEGVETWEQYQELGRLGCDFCQGFYFPRPMPAGRFDALVRQTCHTVG